MYYKILQKSFICKNKDCDDYNKKFPYYEGSISECQSCKKELSICYTYSKKSLVAASMILLFIIFIFKIDFFSPPKTKILPQKKVNNKPVFYDTIRIHGIIPKVESCTSNQIAHEGQTVEIKINAKGSIPLFYHWYLNKKQIAENSNLLKINNVILKDSGIYKVHIFNKYGYTDTTISLTVIKIIVPRITNFLKNQTANVGKDIIFEIKAIGTKPLQYQWYFNNQKVGENSNKLSVHSINKDNAGKYHVTVSNQYGYASSNTAILIVPSNPIPIAVKITKAPKDMRIFEGQNVSLTIEALGTNEIRYEWFHNYNRLNETTNTLVINRIKLSDAGNYRIHVINPYGEDNVTFSMFVDQETPSIKCSKEYYKTRYSLATNYFNDNMYNKSEEILHDLLNSCSETDPYVLFMIGLCRFQNRSYDSTAIRYFDAVVKYRYRINENTLTSILCRAYYCRTYILLQMYYKNKNNDQEGKYLNSVLYSCNDFINIREYEKSDYYKKVVSIKNDLSSQ